MSRKIVIIIMAAALIAWFLPKLLIKIDREQLSIFIFSSSGYTKTYPDSINSVPNDKSKTIEQLKKAGKVKLSAEDMDEEVILDKNQKDALISVFEDLNMDDCDYIEDIFVAKYPNYMITLYQADNLDMRKQISIISAEMIAIYDSNNIEYYAINGDLWERATSLIYPANIMDESSISFLFNAVKTEIIESNIDGDHTERLPWIIRLLKEAEKSDIKLDNTNPSIKIIFTLPDKVYEVDVYMDGFIYNNSYYKRTNILTDLESIIRAG